MSAARRRLLRSALAASAALAAPCAWPAGGGQRVPSAWPAWQAFHRQFVSADGRVIDPATPRRYTTSEGQAYALFFALVAGDREPFDRLLQWTENNLAGGDLGSRLPAWQWGLRDDGQWAVVDANAASDADLWLAYTLGEAARLWRGARYARLAAALAQRIIDEETTWVPGLGRVLLPGPRGFGPVVQNGVTQLRLNPSYLPLPLLRRLAGSSSSGGQAWSEVLASSLSLLTSGAPGGLAADWVTLEHHPDGLRWLAAPEREARLGSYNAIRVYLWLGLTAEDDAALAGLLSHYRPMIDHLERIGAAPLWTDAVLGTATGEGPPGFTAALLPFVERHRRDTLALRLHAALQATPPQPDAYYDQALTLFATAFRSGLYRFDAQGALNPAWT